MEQKRKVKSLISKTNNWELWYFSKFLIILSCLFCFWALGLILFSMSFVDADNTASREVTYPWLDEKKEVLYKLDFVREANLSNIESTMSVDDRWGIDKLYVTPIPIVIKKWYNSNNEYIWVYMSGKFVNLLWWDNLKISWDNVTIIWWYNLVVNRDNDNVTIMWWKENKVTSTSSSVPNVIIWGSGNMVNWDNAVILWWKNNKVYGKDSFILWWERNTISWSDTSNVIVAWYKVTASYSNIFAFSNDNGGFTPKASNAFYINVQKWLWINGNASTWVVSNGAVSFWSLPNCTSNCNWLIWLRNGSLQGYSNNVLRRLWTGDDELEDPQDKDWYCTGADYLKMESNGTGRYSQCASIGDYKNVVFETKILTWMEVCPSIDNWENPCVYKCAEHYSYDQTWDKCMEDCKVPWDLSFTGHGAIITWYSQSWYQCDNNASCNNIMAVLKCVDGDWIKIGGSGADVEKYDDWNINYIYQSCNNLEKKSCDTSVYVFNTTRIDNWRTNGQPCIDYEASTCKSHPYYRWDCYPNYTLDGDACLVGSSKTKKCSCVPWTRTGTCLDSSLPQNAVKLITGFKQIASGNYNNNWYPESKDYVYFTTSNECTYKCDRGYDYVEWAPSLKTKTWCWSGCVLPWSNEKREYGSIIYGVEETDICKSVKMICGEEGKWEDYEYRVNIKKDPIDIYDSEWNIIYNVGYNQTNCEVNS